MPDKICDAAQVGAVRVWLLDLTISGAIRGRCVKTIIVVVIINFVLFQNHKAVLICIVRVSCYFDRPLSERNIVLIIIHNS